MKADEQDPKDPQDPQTGTNPEPNHISGKPYAKSTPTEPSRKSDETAGFGRNDEEPKRPYSWYEVPKERTKPEAPEASPE